MPAPDTPDADRPPRQDFRILTRRRTGYDDAVMVDIQLQVTATGALVWSQTFSDEGQAEAFARELEADLDSLSGDEFRSKHSVPSSI